MDRTEQGHSSSAAPLGLKYSNLPPALIAPRALAGSHYILSLASAVVLASNGPAIALGSLFDNGPLPVSAGVEFEPPLSPSIDTGTHIGGGGLIMGKGDYLDDHGHWRVVLENRIGASSPPWNTPNLRTALEYSA